MVPETKLRKIDQFLPTLTSIFITAKWFGVPVYGGNIYLCLSFCILSMVAAIEVTAIWKLIRAVVVHKNYDERGVTARLSGAVFYANTLLSLLLIWRLVRAWDDLSLYWLRAETKPGIYLQPDRSIKRRAIFVTGLILFCGGVEHSLSIISAVGPDCPWTEYFSRYIVRSHGFVIQPDEYNLWLAIPIFVTSLFATIAWNVQDLIIILISMGLASRYHRLNLFVKALVVHERRWLRKVSVKGVCTWRRLREAYAQQAALVRRVDQQIGLLILLSTVNNLFFICLQLFLGLRKSGGSVMNLVYYFLSLGWMVFRACGVLLAAADVNLHSQRALQTLCSCPNSGYNIEIKRLKYQLINDDICLTGMGLFSLNRQKLLEIATIVVKYELILINYDQ